MDWAAREQQARGEMMRMFADQHRLSLREREVLEMVCAGAKAQTVARRLCRSRATVRLHMKGIYRKTRTRNKLELVLKMWRFSDSAGPPPVTLACHTQATPRQ
jgi:DNA-binding CsgD family transcriptional regulator